MFVARTLVLAILASAVLVVARPVPTGAATDRRIIVIGSDGADHKLVKKYMEEGHLPNLAKLAAEGTYRPLETSNPAQSPVSWATFNTGSNPGKTNIFDFLKRKLPDPGLITFAMAEPETARTFDTPSVRSLVTKVTVGFGAACVLVFLVLGFVFKTSFFVAGVVALLLAGAGAGTGYFVSTKLLPFEITKPKNNMQGTTWVKVASAAGVETKAVQLACAFPPEETPGAKVLAGLGVPDLAASWGTWFYYSSDGSDAGDTQMGGKGLSLDFKPDVTEYALALPGPENPLLRDRIRQLKLESAATSDVTVQTDVEGRVKDLLELEVAPLYTIIEKSSFTFLSAQSLKTDLSRSERSIKNAQAIGSDSPSMPKRLLPFTVKTDPGNGRATFEIGGRSETLETGKWSDFFEPEFEFGGIMKVTGTCRVFLIEASGKGLRFLVSPVNFHPGKLPPNVDVSYPRSYVSDLAADLGCFETLGWACMTNPLKDGKLTEQGFLDHVELVEKPRREMILKELEKNDWQVFFGMLSGTDRVQHMMFRHIDKEHPLYDEALAAEFGGAILDAYKKLDDLVGEIYEKHCQDGNTTLMVISDHGFGSYNRGVNLNSWLVQEGYQFGEFVSDLKIGQITSGNEFFAKTDWTKTKAYSYSLGKICLNLKGRERNGIVTEAEADPLMDEIIEKLKALRDPEHPDRQVVVDVYKAKDIYKGDYWENSEDLIVGFGKGYRIDWDSCLGGCTADVFVPNDSTWSGDHCSIDPSLVPGIFFSNMPLSGDDPRIIDVAPTILTILGLTPPAEWDGKPLPLGE